jgi:hypothetical protein
LNVTDVCSVRSAVYHKYLAESDSQYEMAEIVFTSFDHSITDENSMKLKQISLAQLVRVCVCVCVYLYVLVSPSVCL